MIGFKVHFYFYEVGSGDFLFSFFSTVAIRLEEGKWGSRFPCLMRELYAGELQLGHVKKALAELDQIHAELKEYPPSDVVWDAEDRSKRPPWGDEISEDITDLSNYFVTSDGKDFISVLRAALMKAVAEGKNVEIFSM